MPTFLDYLRRGLEAVGGHQQRLAATLDISEEGLSRALRGRSEYPLGPIACAKLAVLIDEPAGDVLRAADKADFAEAFDAAYGQAVRLRADDRELMRVWREALTAEDRRHLRALINRLAAARK